MSRLYGAAYKFAGIADIGLSLFCYFLFIERIKKHNLLIPGRFIVPESTWPGRGTFFPIPGLSRATGTVPGNPGQLVTLSKGG